MNVIVSLANEYVENSTDQPVVEFYSGNIPEVEFALADSLKQDPSKFKVDTKLGGSEYSIDIKIQNENDYYKINKYGRLL
jgi:hypothetical protein